MTPAATSPVKNQSQCSKGTDEFCKQLILLWRSQIALSNAEMELSKAEESTGRFEVAWIRGVKIAIMWMGCAVLYALWIIVEIIKDDYK
jgi:hypothetical protein